MNKNAIAALAKTKGRKPNSDQVRKITQENEKNLFTKILVKYKIMIIRHKISYTAAK
jgi:hypothetical protein